MKIFPRVNRKMLAAAIAAAMVFAVAAPVGAQSRDDGQTEQSERYPQAAREPAGEMQAPRSIVSDMEEMLELYRADKGAEARAIADAVIAHEDANAYTTSFAAQVASQIAYKSGDSAAAKAYLQQALQSNGLDNNAHYDMMRMLAQLQLADQQYEQVLTTIDRFLTETGSQDPNDLVVKANALFRLDRHEEAAAVLEQAIAATPEPPASWQQMLMVIYSESGQEAKAAELASRIGQNQPTDKRGLLNLAAVHQQAGDMAKVSEVLEKIRAAGEFTEDHDYRLLYSAYLNQEGKEKQAAEVINEGLEKGILEPTYQTWIALGQAYYFSDQIAPAIEAYRKAAPLDDNGKAYLNLAKILRQEGRIAEAKDAARQALAKGLDDATDANRIIALPGG